MPSRIVPASAPAESPRPAATRAAVHHRFAKHVLDHRRPPVWCARAGALPFRWRSCRAGRTVRAAACARRVDSHQSTGGCVGRISLFGASASRNRKQGRGQRDVASRPRRPCSHWQGLTRLLDDGRLELDTNPVENAIRPVALTRKTHCLRATRPVAENSAFARLHRGDLQAQRRQPRPLRRRKLWAPSSTATRRARSKTSCPGDSEKTSKPGPQGIS